jgi:hypothetical protein
MTKPAAATQPARLEIENPSSLSPTDQPTPCPGGCGAVRCWEQSRGHTRMDMKQHEEPNLAFSDDDRIDFIAHSPSTGQSLTQPSSSSKNKPCSSG